MATRANANDLHDREDDDALSSPRSSMADDSEGDDEPMDGVGGGLFDVREDFMVIGRGLDPRLGEEEEYPDDDGVTDRFDRRYDVFRSRWIFLGRYFDDWFSTADYENHDTSSYMAVRFDCFNVQLPTATGAPPHAVEAYLRRLRDVTELVACMLRVDVAAWQFVKKAAKPAFRLFHVASYDPNDLEPKMKFSLSRRGRGGDDLAAIQWLRFMLLECDRDANANANRWGDINGINFFKNRERIRELDTEHRLRGWQIPIAVELTPREPTEATGVEPLRAYLQEIIALIRDLQAKAEDETSAFAFRLVEVELRLFTTRASDVMEQLRELKALGVAVKFLLRHSSRDPYQIDWSHLGPRDNVYPLLADTIGSSQEGELSGLSFRQFSVVSSPQLLSAVASSTTLKQLSLDFCKSRTESAAPAQAKWLAYALRRNQGLEALDVRDFTVTKESLEAMQAVVEAVDPVRLLKEPQGASVSASGQPQFVTLKPTATISTDGNADSRSLSQLGVPLDSEFAVVSTNATPATVEFVVPGHGICSAAEADIASVRSVETLSGQTGGSQLTTLNLEGTRLAAGLVPRFLQLFGRSVQDLRCSVLGDKLQVTERGQQDLSAILTTCPDLTTFSLESIALSSLETITRHFQSPACKIRSLALLEVSVPAPALIAFFEALGDPTSAIARKLEKLYLFYQESPLNADSADAALRMLATNRHLQHITLCVEDAVWASHKARFEAAANVDFGVASRAAALGFLSVHRHHGDDALGRLDSSCIDIIFQYAANKGRRRVLVYRSDDD